MRWLNKELVAERPGRAFVVIQNGKESIAGESGL